MQEADLTIKTHSNALSALLLLVETYSTRPQYSGFLLQIQRTVAQVPCCWSLVHHICIPYYHHRDQWYAAAPRTSSGTTEQRKHRRTHFVTSSCLVKRTTFLHLGLSLCKQCIKVRKKRERKIKQTKTNRLFTRPQQLTIIIIIIIIIIIKRLSKIKRACRR